MCQVELRKDESHETPHVSVCMCHHRHNAFDSAPTDCANYFTTGHVGFDKILYERTIRSHIQSFHLCVKLRIHAANAKRINDVIM